jgi:hypothetical protein
VAQAKLVAELHVLYRAAGRPSYRRISADIKERDDLPDTVSHETVSALLNGSFVPRWSKVESVVRQLASMAVHHPDPDAEVVRFHRLWADSDDDRAGNPGPPRPEAPLELPESFELSGTGTGEVQIGSVPPRNPSFTGREDLLDAMSPQSGDEPWQPLVLHGLSGVGKTSLAIEYVHRTRERYDVVWWIVAEQASQARSALATLGERREWPASQDMRETIRGILGRLESAGFRWLLVFDNAAGPEDIDQLLPAAGGEVIVTTRDAAWLDRGRAITVDVLPRQDSIRLLRGRGGVSFDEAAQLADRLGDLPLALEQAAAMRRATNISVSEYLRRLGENAYEVLNAGRPTDYPETVARAFGVTFAQLRRERPAAAQLLAERGAGVTDLPADRGRGTHPTAPGPAAAAGRRAPGGGPAAAPLRPADHGRRGPAPAGAPPGAADRARLAERGRPAPCVRQRGPTPGGGQPGQPRRPAELGDVRADRP